MGDPSESSGPRGAVEQASEVDVERAAGSEPDEGIGSVGSRPGAAEALPVPAPRARVLPPAGAGAELASERRAAIPAVQAAAVAAGSFVAGAAVVGLVHRRQRRSRALSKPRRGRSGLSHGGGRSAELVQIVSSRSLLLDVHLLGSGPDR